MSGEEESEKKFQTQANKIFLRDEKLIEEEILSRMKGRLNKKKNRGGKEKIFKMKI